MGYGFYQISDPATGELMDRGYSVPDVCPIEGCRRKIDRGMAYLCYSCTHYFCPDHLTVAYDSDDDTALEFECFAGTSIQVCINCCKEYESNLPPYAESDEDDLNFHDEGR